MLVSGNMTSNKKQDRALDFYEHNARNYFEATRNADISALYECFLAKLPKGAKILDAGSGSGRDTLAFLQRGYVVSAFDSSPALCKLSSQLTGVQPRVLRFQDFQDKEKYDGIWACASLLHVPKAELPDAINRLVQALKLEGVLYMSFRHGVGERVTPDGRFYTDMTERCLRRVLHEVPNAKLESLWVTTGEGKYQGQGEWLNALVYKHKRGVSQSG